MGGGGRTLAAPVTAFLRWLSEQPAMHLAVGVSVVLHGVLLSLHFQYPDASRAFRDQALDIILVNSKSARKPTKAQALAQANLDGGGTTDQERRAKTPLPPSAKQQSGSELEQAQKRVQQLEARQQHLLEQAQGKRLIGPRRDGEAKPDPTPAPSGRDLMSSALEMARLEGEIARQTEEYNKRPRVKNLGTRTEEYRFARYMEEWRQKVERVGTLNYPEAARGKLSGSLTLTVRIKSDGSVESVEIDRSSGHKVLDDAAKRIVRMAAPYAAFSPDVRRDVDVIAITRKWNFTASNALETTRAP
ncbi:energy transducer TonB [Propionivibrio limicola]|uniref:energy transducer TonB n=1 Tax=Propionivibrio limicola TaxID=167645 RepID=UPI001FEBDFC7|nr:energy transducer TonB [Propionivibrio limicola]